MVTKAVVFASGQGTPVNAPGAPGAPLGFAPSRPGLLPVANQPLLLHALGALRRAGVTQVALMAPRGLAEHLLGIVADGECTGLAVDCLACPSPDLASSLEAAEDFIDGDRFVLHLGDSLGRDSLRPLLDEARTGDRDALVFVHDGPAAAATQPACEVIPLPHCPGPPRTPAPTQLAGAACAGLFVLGSGAVQAAREASSGESLDIEIATVLGRLEQEGGHLETRPLRDWWRYQGAPDTMLEANRFALEGLRGRTDGATLVDSVIQSAVRIDRSARLDSTVVRGPAVIGPGARLRDAYVGPYTSIGAGALIEGAEIENSIVLPGASISHLSGRLEASVIGPGAKVFRDFQLPRAMRLTVGEGAVVALS